MGVQSRFGIERYEWVLGELDNVQQSFCWDSILENCVREIYFMLFIFSYMIIFFILFFMEQSVIFLKKNKEKVILVLVLGNLLELFFWLVVLDNDELGIVFEFWRFVLVFLGYLVYKVDYQVGSGFFVLVVQGFLSVKNQYFF